MITHTVFFKLKHRKDSPEEVAFFEKALALGSIRTVQNLRRVREVHSQNRFDYGLMMNFKDQEALEYYSNHPDHQNFVKEIWLKEVADFQEIDYMEWEEGR